MVPEVATYGHQQRIRLIPKALRSTHPRKDPSSGLSRKLAPGRFPYEQVSMLAVISSLSLSGTSLAFKGVR